MPYLVKIVVSGSGKSHTVATVDSLKEASGVVKTLDVIWGLWVAKQFPPSWPVFIRYYEGCDIYATNTKTNTIYTYNEDEVWEKV